ncbi:hypothetical protein NDU88_002444 [Pleurodeles waltl]|uniref:NmrA-like family domain-containing protein 1 n=1 Tax=Pleurodeles waltl TaxID=8319 RepID=A0AAV7M0K2_PLEWA|nr:hypothetical protein NDU88_002444 [Pleurodeles waltl]
MSRTEVVAPSWHIIAAEERSARALFAGAREWLQAKTSGAGHPPTAGKALADLSKDVGLQHVVFSGLENVKKLTGGKLEVLHFDGKAVPMGDIPMDGLAVDDLGPVVVSVLKAPEQFIGRDIGLSSEKLTTEQCAAIMTKITGKKVKDAKITPETYEKLGFRGAAELANRFRFYTMKLNGDIELTLQLNPNTKKFAEWMELKKDAFKDCSGWIMSWGPLVFFSW